MAEDEQTASFIPSLINVEHALPDSFQLNKRDECSKRPYQQDNFAKEFANLDHFEPTLSAECEPLTTVAGCVNVLSGQFFQIEKDLKGTSIDPLDFVRYYDSGSGAESFLGYGFGSGFPIWASDREKGSRHHYGLISERENFFLLYSDKEKSSSDICHVDSRILEKGYTNLCRAKIGGKTNFVNWKALFRSKGNASYWLVKLGDGTRRTYSKSVKINKMLRSRMQFPTEKAYLLEKEIKPNGNQLIFEYQSVDGKIRLNRIQTLNRSGSAILNQLAFAYQKGICTVIDDCGHRVTFHKKKEIRNFKTSLGLRLLERNFLEQVDSTQKKEPLNYTLQPFTWLMDEIQKPGKQFLRIKYDESGRVKTLSAPQETQEAITLYQFRYLPNSTEVLDAIGQLTLYTFDDHQRVSDIQYIDQANHTIRKDTFNWSKKENEKGWLTSKSIGKPDGQLHYLKTYEYDEKGNVKKETLYGNLSGTKSDSFSIDEKEKMDDSSITYHYSHDGFNLVTQKSTDEGLTLYYDYLEGTNLCTKILTHYKGKIQEREFRAYDDNGELLILIEDDGSSKDENDLTDVNFRRMKQIESVKEKGPSFGKPWKIKTFYRDHQTGNDVPVLQTTISYDSHGFEKERETIDSKGRKYLSSKTHDQFLHLKSETNALGETTEYAYDANGNKVSEERLKSGKKTFYTYDFANRLKEKKEKHKHSEFVTSYQYNALNQLISEIDAYGHQTTYAYDRLGNQTLCKKPDFQNSDGTLFSGVLIKEYNLLNQAISITNENGHTTKYAYNTYGNPTKISYPDQTKERLIYYPCGWLKEKIQADQTSIFYRYDAKGHLIEETFKDEQGNLLKTEKYHYKGPLLQYKTDAMGLKTRYEYDGAGRKIKETIGHLKTIHYRYDDFDQLIEKREEDRVETQEYDLIGQVIGKEVHENGILVSKEAYTYDIQGNPTTKTVWQSLDHAAIYTVRYYSDGAIKWKEDPLGNRTRYSYDHATPYALGHHIKTIKILDPLGRLTRETYDPYNRLSKKEIFDQDRCVSLTEWAYDAAGNCIKEKALVMTNGEPIRDYWIERNYNRRVLLEEEIEMPKSKSTKYHYDRMQRLLQKIKPNGDEIDYAYDSLGRLKALTASNGSIAYLYDYDLHDNITKVEDSIHKITQTRSFDLYNRMKEETISAGVVISYEYDKRDRVKKLTLPGGSFMTYTYEAHLTKIERHMPDGAISYTMNFPTYDLRSNLLEIHSPAGKTHYTYDILGRAINIQSQHWESHLEHFDPAGNLTYMRQRDPGGIINGEFSYDRFDHLTQETLNEPHHYLYDSLGNCIQKDSKPCRINALNQLKQDGESDYTYDSNGNLRKQSSPPTSFVYDALNRLILCEKEGQHTHFLYDAFGRCLQITDGCRSKKLLYQGEQEIGSIVNEKIEELCLVYPNIDYDQTFAIELEGEPFFPIQDFRGNICALQRQDGSLAEWTRYTAFGEKVISGNTQGLFNPWRFANRREVADLSLFAHRFYNPRLMRWLTTDPLQFEDGLNLYAYVHNNPFCYKDPDGRFAFTLAIPVFEATFGAVLTTAFLPAIGTTLAVAAVGYSCYQLGTYVNNQINNVEVEGNGIENRGEKNGRKKGKDNEIKGGPPRDRYTGNYLPDPKAEGAAHTTIGTKTGRRVGGYTQGATFNDKGEFKGRTDLTDHGRRDHPNPHYHQSTGPNSADSLPTPISIFFW